MISTHSIFDDLLKPTGATMDYPSDGIAAEPDKKFWERPLTLDFGSFFRNLGKATTFVVAAQYDKAITSAIDGLGDIGIRRTNSQLAGLLITRAMASAVGSLLRDYLRDFPEVLEDGADDFNAEITQKICANEYRIDIDFFDKPHELPFVEDFANRLESWIGFHGPDSLQPKTIASRLPSYFVWALHIEFQKNGSTYTSLLDAIESPVKEAWKRRRNWEAYFASLEREVAEPVFGATYSLRQIYQWPAAFFLQSDPTATRTTPSNGKQFVVDLKDYLDQWLEGSDDASRCSQQNTIKIISGDPGSGKSAFSKMYACHRAKRGDHVLLVPLHRLNVQDEFGGEIEKYCEETDNCPTGLMNSETAEQRLLIVLDGLDELAKQGRIGAQIAREFTEEVIRKVNNRNASSLRLCVLISGRPIAVQNVTDKFRKEEQILTLLPYYTKTPGPKFTGCTDLLKRDQRDIWWASFASLTGATYSSLPDELRHNQLLELTSQPLLNLLLALVFEHETSLPKEERTIEFDEHLNLNQIYSVLLDHVYDRDWDSSKSHKALGSIDRESFRSLLEEMAIAAWHGVERTTTVNAVRERCEASYLKDTLEEYERNCSEGVASLFTAFYFRKSEKTEGLDPTFEFTHKSFGEYLTAVGILNSLVDLNGQLKNTEGKRRFNNFRYSEALLEWWKLMGPSALSTEVSKYLMNEIMLRSGTETFNPFELQTMLIRLLDESIKEDTPIERVEGLSTYAIMRSHAARSLRAITSINAILGSITKRPAEEVVWNGEDSAMKLLQQIELPGFGFNVSYLTFNGQLLHGCSFNFQEMISTRFLNSELLDCSFRGSSLREADFSDSKLLGVSFESSDLQKASFKNTRLTPIYVKSGRHIHVSIEGADLRDAKYAEYLILNSIGTPSRLPNGAKPSVDEMISLRKINQSQRSK